jgi:hypothetical protein
MTPTEKVTALEETVETHRREMGELRANYVATVDDILRKAEERQRQEAEAAGRLYTSQRRTFSSRATASSSVTSSDGKRIEARTGQSSFRKRCG